MKDAFRIGDDTHSLWISPEGDGVRLHLPEDTVSARRESISGTAQSIRVGDGAYAVCVARIGDRLYIHACGAAHEVAYLPAASLYAGKDAGSDADELLAPMPGAVVACAVAAGDDVATGDILLVIESMKLETSLKAWRAGRVDKVHFAVGQSFERDRVLLSLEAAP
jgi:acetyl/propionyl-CoA carboxylase alpha subunit